MPATTTSINTIGDTQRQYLQTLAGHTRPLNIPTIASLCGMEKWRKSYQYRPMITLWLRGLVDRVGDPRCSAWSLWKITGAGRQSLRELGLDS